MVKVKVIIGMAVVAYLTTIAVGLYARDYYGPAMLAGLTGRWIYVSGVATEVTVGDHNRLRRTTLGRSHAVSIADRAVLDGSVSYEDAAIRDSDKCRAVITVNATATDVVLQPTECGGLRWVDHGWLISWKSISLRMDRAGRLHVSAVAEYIVNFEEESFTTTTMVTGVLVRATGSP
jgi:hypothetical protein